MDLQKPKPWNGFERKETEDHAAGYHRVERAYGQFRRISSCPTTGM